VSTSLLPRDLITATHHVERIATQAPSFADALDALRAQQLDVDAQHETLRGLAATGYALHVTLTGHAAARRALAVEAGQLADDAWRWTRQLRVHLDLAAHLGGPPAAQAAHEVRVALGLRAPRFAGAVADLRRAIPLLELHAARLGVHPQAEAVRDDGRALLARAERILRDDGLREQDELDAAAAVAAHLTRVVRVVDTLRAQWTLAQLREPDAVPAWPFGALPRAVRRRV
jgi:hypothetical protein